MDQVVDQLQAKELELDQDQLLVEMPVLKVQELAVEVLM
jgi:hypothetical protein